jgi:hypothetical protein
MHSNRSSSRLNLSSHAKVHSTRIRNAWMAALHNRFRPHLIGIPFESLFTADGKPVILRHTVRYAFGLQPGLARYPKLSSIRRAVVVGVEDFSGVNRPLLLSSRIEVEQLRELLRARGTAVLPKDAMPRSGKDLFTETKPLDVIHISTHSRLDRTIPLLDY